MQSPNPLEIRSRKSPEKLRLPQPTDLDLATLRPNEDDAWLPLGLASSFPAKASSSFAAFGSSEAQLPVTADEEEVEEVDLRLVMKEVGIGAEEVDEEYESVRKDQKLFFRGLSDASVISPRRREATDLLRLSRSDSPFGSAAAAAAVELVFILRRRCLAEKKEMRLEGKAGRSEEGKEGGEDEEDGAGGVEKKGSENLEEETSLPSFS